MLIQCTKKLLDKIDFPLETGVEEDPLFSWHANLIIVNRKNVVVLVNDKSRYPVVLFGLKAKDFKKLDKLIVEGIAAAFKEECIDEMIIKKFVAKCKTVRFSKTKDKSSVAKLNKGCDMAYFYANLVNPNSISQGYLSSKISNYLVGRGCNDYFYPNEELYKDLEQFAGASIFNHKAVQVRISLDLDGTEVWRRLIVPANFTFERFHHAIQRAFAWKDYHFHEFFIYSEEKLNDLNSYRNHLAYTKEGYTPILNIIEPDNDYAHLKDLPIKDEKEARLIDYIPARMKYIYDYGDLWSHHIVVEKILDEYDKNHPVCMDFEGNSPPEDVGGSPGFKEFLQIIADQNHPDHSFAVTWGKQQGYAEIDLGLINHRLKSI